MFIKTRYSIDMKLIRSFFIFIADLRLAIILLLLIALFSITGTVIEQGQSFNFYQTNYPDSPALFGFITANFILKTGLDHVYTTYWFVVLLAIFGLSLITCTFRRQIPTLKTAKNWQYLNKIEQFEKLALSAELNTGSPQSLVPLLQEKGYKIFQEGDQLYARKGLIGRIGPIIVHIGMIIVLMGSVVGAFTGFIAQEMITDGETFQVKNIFQAGRFSNSQIPKDWAVKVNRFWIDYTAEGKVDQFYSDLSVVSEKGEELDHDVIYVNKPLRYKGVTFYQTDWGISAVQVRLNKSPIFQIPMALLNGAKGGKLWGAWIPLKPDLSEGFSLIAKDLQGAVFLYDQEGKLINALRVGQSIEINGVRVSLLKLLGSTGLQIKADPGIPIVYLGFAVLMAGVVMSYVSHSQIWALQQGDRFYIGGKTNRALITFEKELIEIVDRLQSSLNPSLISS